ncbi:MAG: sulfur carrier protein ThiS [Acidimicrobiales bacterium]
MIRVNGTDDDYMNETVAELLVRRDVAQRGIAVALNGEVVRRSEWATTRIPDAAFIEIVTAAAGG